MSLLRLAFVATLFIGFATAQEQEPTFTVVIAPDGSASVTGGTASLRDQDIGSRYVFDLQASTSSTVAAVKVTGMDVARPQQLVALLDDSDHASPHTFAPAATFPTDVTQHVAQYTGGAADFTVRLGIPATGPATLTLIRDVSAPAVIMDRTQNVTHVSFEQTVRSHEWTRADLQIWPAITGTIRHVASDAPALAHTLAVDRLAPNTTYGYRIVLHDLAGNEASSADYEITTPMRPLIERPTVVRVEPADGIRLPAVARVFAEFTSPTTIALDDVQFFVDKRVVGDGRQIDHTPGDVHGYVISYERDFEPGRHSVTVQATNEAGGMGVASWAFFVGEEQETAPGAGIWLAGILLAAAFVRRRC